MEQFLTHEKQLQTIVPALFCFLSKFFIKKSASCRVSERVSILNKFWLMYGFTSDAGDSFS